MPVTYKLISTVTVGSGGAATIEFTSIPGTFDDLLIKASTRHATGASELILRFNGTTTTYSTRYLQGSGSTATSGTFGTSSFYLNEENYNSYTASTFASTEIYVPNYAGSTNKSISSDSVTENNATQSWQQLTAGLWSTTTAISTITLLHSSGNFAEHSTATLYGIKKS